MKNFYYAISLIVVLLLFSGCKGETALFEVSEANQVVYFQFEYMNHAWGYQHYGWLVDSSGNVNCYNKPGNWIHADSFLLISKAAMESNVLATDSVCYVISEEVFKSKMHLINGASRGKVTEPVHEMYDAGVGIYSAYIYNSERKVYKKIVLKQHGDYRIDNYAPEAKDLYKWMESINNDIQAYK